MSEGEVSAAQRWVQNYRPGGELLGYCDLFKRPVTYYIGFCWGYGRAVEANGTGVPSRAYCPGWAWSTAPIAPHKTPSSRRSHQ